MPRLRSIHLLMWVVCVLLISSSSLMAQDTPAETPTETPAVILETTTPTDVPAEAPTEAATEAATEIPTEAATEVPTEVVTEAATEIPTEATEVATEAPATTEPETPAATDAPVVVVPALPTEPELSLLARDLFETEPLTGWTLPAGWTRTAVSDGFALQIASATSESAAEYTGTFANVAVMGYFTFADNSGAASLSVRNSAAGSYVAQIDAAGNVSLAKRDAAGTATVLGNAAAPATGAARRVRLSAIGDVLRVAVDDVELIAVQDAAPLPAGSVRIGVASGTVLFDNFFLWIPAGEAALYTPATAPATEATTAPVVTNTPEATRPSGSRPGKSTIFQSPPPANGALGGENDAFVDRIGIPNAPFADSGSTAGNSVEAGEPVPSCGFNITNTAWYEFQPPASAPSHENFLLTTAGSNFDTMLVVYTGSWGAMTQIACSDDVGSSTQAQLTLDLQDSQTYYIQIGGYNGSVGNVNFALVRPTDTAVPTAPVIATSATGAPSTPLANAARTKNLTPVLAWNPTGAVVPNTYLIQLSTVATFATLVSSDTIVEPQRYWQVTPTLTNPALAAGQTYYWRVAARNFLGQSSPYSAVYSFTLDTVAPNAPALIAPAVEGIVTTLRPTFSWSAVADASSYNVFVATNFSCATVVSDPGNAFDRVVTTTSYTPAVDLPQGEYWFCVASRDLAGNSNGFVGEKRKFYVNVSLTPANKALIVAAAPTFKANVVLTWTAITGASYALDVARDLSFTDMVLSNQSVTPATYTLMAQDVGTYFWRVTVNGQQLPMSLARSYTISPALPPAPLIQTTGAVAGAVLNAGFTNDTTPTLDWTIPAGWNPPPAFQSLTYEFELSTNNTFTALVAPRVTGIAVDNYEWTATTLNATPGTIYYWHVRGMTNLGLFTAWSAVYSFTLDTTPPNAPNSLTAPLDNATSSLARPVFTWTAAPGATKYRFEISPNSADFSQTSIPADAIVTTLTYTPTVSLPQGTYYWQVWGIDAAGNESTAPAGYRTLNIDYRLAPAAGYSLATVGAATGAPVTFTWTPVTGAPAGTTYTIEIDASPFDTVPDFTPIPGTTPWLSPAIPHGAYRYRLVVNNGFGASGWRGFVVSPPLPGAPVAPFTPVNAFITSNPMPQLGWTAPTLNAGSVTGYSVEISTNNTFTAQVAGSPFDASNALTFAPPAPLPNTPLYYWRVRAYTALGAFGPYSAPLSFTVDTVEPGLPTLTAPLDNAVTNLARPTFTWTAGSGANRYRIEIATDTAFNTLALPFATVTTLSYPAVASLPQGTYYWHVFAIDAAGNESSTPTPYRTLTVDYRTAPAANFNVFTATTATIAFTWTPIPGAIAGTNYVIQIDNDMNAVPDVSSTAVTTGTVSMTGVIQGQHQYRLVANNGYGMSAWRPFTVSPLQPGAPLAPFTPANASFTNNTMPTFTWAAPTVNPANVIGYSLEVSTNAAFTAPIAGSPFTVNNVLTFPLPAPLANTPGQVYYWRLRARSNFNQFGPYTAVMSFTLDTTPPAAPTLTAPVDASVTNLARPTFSWGAVTGANRYVIEIDDENTFAPALFYTATVTTVSHMLPTTTYLRQGTYYWRVWAMDAAGNMSTTPATFRALNVNYANMPANNAVITTATSTNVTVTWTPIPITPVSNVIRVQIDTDAAFGAPIFRQSSLMASNLTSYTTTSPLPAGKYYWRVLVTGHPSWSTSLVRSFTVSPAAPVAPALNAPATATNDTTPLFGWNTVSGANGYELQLSTVSTFATLVGGTPITINNGSTSSYTWATLLPDSAGTAYYARIRAFSSLGVFSAFSATRIFTLDTVAPTIAPTLTAPAHNATVITTTPTFTWATVTGAARYEIRYGTTSNLSAVTPISATPPSYMVTAPLLFTNYYWEVRALDAAGNAGPWSTQRTVKIVSPAGSAPTLWGFTLAQPDLKWSALAWAQMYEIQVSRNTAFTDIVWSSNTIPASTGGIPVNAPHVAVGTPLGNGTYYWRVRALMPQVTPPTPAVWGAWSATVSFTVES